MRVHIGKVAAICFFHLRRLRLLRFLLTSSLMHRLVSALVISRIDYCNSVLYGLPAITLAPLQRVLHAAVRLVANLGYRNHHVTPAMKELHWLPIAYRIRYKLCLMMHVAVNKRSPAYITDTLVPTSSLLHRERLRSHKSESVEVPRVRTEFGRRPFSIAGPTVWNALPNNVRRTETVTTFKRVRKLICSNWLMTVDVYLPYLTWLVKRPWTMWDSIRCAIYVNIAIAIRSSECALV